MSGIKALLRRNPLMDTLINLRGNARACIYTEPLWGVPVNLYLPLAAKYMEALGLDNVKIGVVVTVYLLSQMLFSLIGGVMTDRLGRRWTTVIADVFAWIIPFLLWMNAQGFAWFVIAAAFNGANRISENSFGLLMVEDTPRHLLVSLYAFLNIATLLAGFAAPLTSLLVSRFPLVSVMRGLYFFAFLSMALKMYLLHRLTRETAAGEARKRELRGKPLGYALRGSGRVLRSMFRKRELMLVLGIMSCVMVIRSATENFWPLLLTGGLGIGEESLPLLSGLRSVVMLVGYFTLSQRLSPKRFFKPIGIGLSILFLLHLMLFLLPRNAAFLVFPGVVAEAVALSMLIPLFSSLQMLLLDQSERARMFGFSLAFSLLVTSPFGTLNGFLSKWHLALPMLLSALLALAALFLLMKLRAALDVETLDEPETANA